MSVTLEQLAAVRLDDLTVLLERRWVRDFARTVGAVGTVHDDLDVAQAAGHPDLVVLPSFFFTVENERARPLGDLTGVVDEARILHAEQGFQHHRLVHAGDTLRVRSSWTDAFEKGGGRLQFLVRETRFLRADDLVATATTTLVVPS